MHRFVSAASLGAGLVLTATLASAVTPPLAPTGRWDREDGLGGIEITSCGDALCGHVTWLRNADGPAHVGQKVLYDMRRTARETWTGTAVNPEDGRTYNGTMTLLGSRLATKGCLLGGLLCQSVALIRPPETSGAHGGDRGL